MRIHISMAAAGLLATAITACGAGPPASPSNSNAPAGEGSALIKPLHRAKQAAAEAEAAQERRNDSIKAIDR